jgi:hypothetical protein
MAESVQCRPLVRRLSEDGWAMPVEVLEQWFTAHSKGDLEAARSLMVEGALVSVPGRRLHGFDALMDWCRERASGAKVFDECT